ncbi:MAG: hypothetical protein JWM39_147 [Parcubacteria group bacterium]|nr:hypothetical protein [Parcubacteria group bacterium]
MRLRILAIIAALMFSASAAYFFIGSSNQLAAAETSNTAQTTILFDTSRIVELLKQLLSIRNATRATVTIPFATTSSSTPSKTVSVATTTPVKKPAAAAGTSAPLPASAPAPAATSAQSPTQTALGLALPNLRSALVNIICLPNNVGPLRGISGSGIIIDPRGIILTVAHVAQYELLAEARPDLMTCYVRTGSPAVNEYKAAPIYVSSNWISLNSKTISSASPTGTGENDFALLAITGSNTSASLPSTFSFVPLANVISTVGDPVVIGSYGAEFLTTARIEADLFPTLVYDTVQDRFTFGTNTVDLISLGGGAAAQQGSSGGGIANQNGQLVGLITTSSSGSDINTRDLHAITTSYLQRAFKLESGSDLTSYITSTNSTALVAAYASKATQLANTLLSANNLK